MSEGAFRMRDKKEVNVSIGSRIHNARVRAGLTQDALAEMISIHPQNLSAIERGVNGVSLPTLMSICKKLSVSSDYILFGEYNDLDMRYTDMRLKQLPLKKQAMVIDSMNKLIDMFDGIDS